MARIDNRGNLRGSAANARGGAVTSRGSRDLLAVSKALKNAGEGELRKQFHKTLRDSAKPLIPKVREAARRDLPTKGGLNQRIATKPYRIQVRTGNRTAGVRIVGTKVDPRINDLGRIQHPVFGRPGKRVVQYDKDTKGYFDQTLSESGPEVSREVMAAMNGFTRKLIRGDV